MQIKIKLLIYDALKEIWLIYFSYLDFLSSQMDQDVNSQKKNIPK